MPNYIQIKSELEAVQLSLEIWKFLKETGLNKCDYDEKLDKLYFAECPLCQFHIEQNEQVRSKSKNYIPAGCQDCCLKPERLCHFSEAGSAYNAWYEDEDIEQKKQYAEILYDALVEREEELI